MPKSIQRRLGARIAALRKERGWTQDNLGEYSHISREHISHLENGLREASLGTLIKLAAAFGMKISQLIEGID